jgi:hypothetical protein
MAVIAVPDGAATWFGRVCIQPRMPPNRLPAVQQSTMSGMNSLSHRDPAVAHPDSTADQSAHAANTTVAPHDTTATSPSVAVALAP